MTEPISEPSETWWEMNSGFIIKLGIFIALLILILYSTGYMKKIVLYINPDIETCKGGTCRSLCIKGSEMQKQGSQCSDTSKICCVKNTRSPSPECNGRTKGEPCGTTMVCDEFLVCISRCEYCSQYPDDTKVCTITGKVIGKTVDKFDYNFVCGCSENDCNVLDNSKMGSCVEGFCPSQNPVASDYMCCSTLYKK